MEVSLCTLSPASQYIQEYSEVDTEDYELFLLSRWCLEVTLNTIKAEPHRCIYLTASDVRSRRPTLKRQEMVESFGTGGSVPATPTGDIPTVSVTEEGPIPTSKLQVLSVS